MLRSPGNPGGVRFRVIAPPCLFFVSGMCALMDEVLWARAVGTLLGASYQVQALVLGVFFTAIPIGAAVGTRWVRQHAPRRLWLCYGACEGATAVAVLAPVALASGGFGSGRTDTTAAYLVLALLALPGACVGATWPLMAALARRRASGLGWLYAVNTFGGALGALLASLLLLERLGTSGALLISAGLSALAALVGTFASLREPQHRSATTPLEPAASATSTSEPRETAEGSAAQTRPRAESPLRIPLQRGAREPGLAPDAARPAWYIGSLVGFLTIAFEVLGVRILALRFVATTQNLAFVLAVQLTGMAIGACLVPLYLRGGRRALSIALTFAALGTALPSILASFHEPPTAASSWALTCFQCIGDAALILGPGATTLGAVFPLASSLLSLRYPGDYGKIGLLATVNGACGMIGALTTNLVIVPTLGISGSFALVALVLGLSAAFTAGRA
ncbi:MAG TPA: MFS transporter, partial [Polyangiaceae bacterium]|nr:MFS transporter [Polyangiaceae bacterium]